MTKEQMADRIEDLFLEIYGLKLDFDSKDELEKLLIEHRDIHPIYAQIGALAYKIRLGE
jgi:hypothetical protein